MGLPGVLKTAAFGYDDKGQVKLTSDLPLPLSKWTPSSSEHVYEAFVDFERELSVVAARAVDGAFAHWGVIENTHVNHILDVSVSPGQP